MRCLTTLVLLALTSTAAWSQPDYPTVAFEAASIEPFPEGSPIMMSGCVGGPGSGDPGRIHCEYTTLTMLLTRAYLVKNQQIAGPSWMDSVHFNIIAKLPAGATKEQVPAMFRNVLADRFKVVLHHETRLLPAYSLTVSKTGIKMKESGSPAAPSANGTPPPGGKLPIGDDSFPILRPSSYASGPIVLYRQGRARLQASNTTAAMLAEALSRQLDRVVVDETGLTGRYDMTLYWTPDAGEPGGSQREAASNDPSAPEANLFAAIERQLGLKLVSKKVECDTIVIDRAERKPTEN
jgi:uncharacterized protein (TIGR03435 family)